MSEPERERPKRNRHGREIWFVSRTGEGTYEPVHSKGCLAFVLAAVWVLFSGAVGMALFVVWQSGAAFVLMFALAVPGLVLMGVTVYRHS